MLKLLRLGLCCALLLAATHGRAEGPPGPTQVASDAYERGMAHFRLDEFGDAIKAWEEGFRVKPAPEFLYNIAQAYKAWKKPDKAISFYRKYLDMDPKARNRSAVEQTIVVLEAQGHDASAPAPVVAPAPAPVVAPAPAPVVAPAPAPVVAPAPVRVPVAAPALAPEAMPTSSIVVAAPPEKKPLVKRAWFWGVVGTGIVVVAGVVVVGVVLGTRSSGPRTIPSVTF